MSPISPNILKTLIEAQGGVSKLNRYRVIMPTFFIGGDAITLDVQCRSATIPGRSINTVVRRTNMKEIQTPAGYSNTPVDFIFTESNNFNVSRYLDEWMGRVVNPETYEVEYRENVVRDIMVMSTDASGVPQYVCILRNAFPKTKAQIDMSDNNESVATEVRATFEYEDYEIVDNPLLSGVQDGIRSLRAGKLKLPTNLMRSIDGSAVDKIKGLF